MGRELQFGRTYIVVVDRNVNAHACVQNVLAPIVVPFMNMSGEIR